MLWAKVPENLGSISGNTVPFNPGRPRPPNPTLRGGIANPMRTQGSKVLPSSWSQPGRLESLRCSLSASADFVITENPSWRHGRFPIPIRHSSFPNPVFGRSAFSAHFRPSRNHDCNWPTSERNRSILRLRVATTWKQPDFLVPPPLQLLLLWRGFQKQGRIQDS